MLSEARAKVPHGLTINLEKLLIDALRAQLKVFLSGEVVTKVSSNADGLNAFEKVLNGLLMTRGEHEELLACRTMCDAQKENNSRARKGDSICSAMEALLADDSNDEAYEKRQQRCSSILVTPISGRVVERGSSSCYERPAHSRRH